MQSRFTRLVLILALLIAAGFALARVVKGPTPVKFAVAQSDPIGMIQHGDAWYWIERPEKGKARLSRNGEVIFIADSIYGFDVDGIKTAVTSKDGNKSSVKLLDGGSTKELWSGTETPGRPAIAGNQVLWALSREGSVKSSTPLAALGAQSQAFVADADGRPRPLASLPESPLNMLGVRDGNAYASSVRQGQALSTAMYAIPINGGLPQRVAAESGASPALLRSDGKLVWVADSRDAANAGTANAVRTLGRDGQSITIAEWLPVSGRLFESRGDTIYVDPTFVAAIWLIRTNNEYPDRLAMPRGYAPLAIGESQVMLRKSGMSNTIELYVIPRP